MPDRRTVLAEVQTCISNKLSNIIEGSLVSHLALNLYVLVSQQGQIFMHNPLKK